MDATAAPFGTHPEPPGRTRAATLEFACRGRLRLLATVAVVVVGVALVVGLILLARDLSSVVPIAAATVLALLILLVGAGLVHVAWRAERRLCVGPDGLALVNGAGEAVQVAWRDVARVRVRALDGAFELADHAGTVLRVRGGLHDHNTFLAEVMTRIDRARGEDAAGAGAPVALPASYRRAFAGHAAAAAGVLLGLGLGVLGDARLFVLALLGLGGLLYHLLRRPYRVIIGHTAVRVLKPWTTTVVHLRAVRRVRLGMVGARPARPAILVEGVDGRVGRIDGLGDALLEAYDHLRAALGADGAPRVRAAGYGIVGESPALRRTAVAAALVAALALVGGAVYAVIVGGAPLVAAARGGNERLVELLLERGVSVDHPDRQGRTALYEAAKYGHVELVEDLHGRGAALVVHAFNAGHTPLHVAAENQRVDVMRYLLDHGVDPDVRNHWEQTPLLQLAMLSRSTDTAAAALLLERGADPSAADFRGFTPLHVAARRGDVSHVRLLVRHGAALEARVGSGQTPLLLAAYEQRHAAAAALVEAGAELDVRDPNNGRTALAVALARRDREMARLLVDAGARSDIPGDDGWTPMHFAVDGEYVEILRAMLDAGHSPDAATPRVGSALYVAAIRGRTEAARVLLEHGAALDVRHQGWTPLAAAQERGHAEVARLLRRHGAVR